MCEKLNSQNRQLVNNLEKNQSIPRRLLQLETPLKKKRPCNKTGPPYTLIEIDHKAFPALPYFFKVHQPVVGFVPVAQWQ